MKAKIILTTLLLGFSLSGYPQNTLQRDSLRSDFRTLVRYIEETHPDPYTIFGGRVAFRIEVQETELQIGEEMTLEQYSALLSRFVSNLRDGHTYVRPATSSGGNATRILPVKTRVIEEGILFIGLPDSLHPALGSLIESVNGVPAEELKERAIEYRPTENDPGAWKSLAQLISTSSAARSLFSNVEALTFTVKCAGGEKHTFSLPFTEREAIGNLSEIPAWDDYPDNDYLAYRFIDAANQTMLFRLASVADRSAFRMMQSNGMAYNDYLTWFYRQYIGGELPETTDEMIDALPCLSEEFSHMLKEMKRHRSQNLIIDLRGNSGGMTPITLPTIYQLYGDRYLETDMGNRFYRIVSPLYMEKMGTTLDEFNQKRNPPLYFGDIIYSEQSGIPVEEKREQFLQNAMDCVRPFLPDDGTATYTPPKVYVITDVNTFSAAFHYSYYLSKMGAIIVGTTSGQAPNCFMESTPFTLPYSGLTGSISNSLQQFLPMEDPRAREFTPDIPIDYETWEKYGFDAHTPVLYLLHEVIGK